MSYDLPRIVDSARHGVGHLHGDELCVLARLLCGKPGTGAQDKPKRGAKPGRPRIHEPVPVAVRLSRRAIRERQAIALVRQLGNTCHAQRLADEMGLTRRGAGHLLGSLEARGVLRSEVVACQTQSGRRRVYRVNEDPSE